jgi:transcriptional regulator CtsR
MGNLADYIEAHIKNLFNRATKEVIELQRRELAEQFGCVPSQITYVLSTRFTLDRGYVVESYRGGGGYIRIVRITKDPEDIVNLVSEKTVTGLSEKELTGVLSHLIELKRISTAEAIMIRAIIEEELKGVSSSDKDIFRAKLLRTVLRIFLK